jgi:hypothetical protein
MHGRRELSLSRDAHHVGGAETTKHGTTKDFINAQVWNKNAMGAAVTSIKKKTLATWDYTKGGL